MEHIHTDICVIGGGSGGLSFAAGAAQMGARVVLFEADRMGVDCLNSGCVPSKALLAAAKAAHHAQGNPQIGIHGTTARVDFAAVKAHVADVIAGIAPHDSAERFSGLGVTVIPEFARFAGKPSAARAAGSICANNPIPIIYPCHRVIRADGKFGNYGGGSDYHSTHSDNVARKAALIKLESC